MNVHLPYVVLVHNYNFFSNPYTDLQGVNMLLQLIICGNSMFVVNFIMLDLHITFNNAVNYMWSCKMLLV